MSNGHLRRERDTPRITFDSVCICVIMPGLPAGVSADTMRTLWGIRSLYEENDQGGDLHVAFVQGASYENALAEVAAIADQVSPARRFFFLDTDIAFDPKWFAPFVTLDRDILVGTYQQRTAPADWCVNTCDQGEYESELLVDRSGVRVVRINDTGFGAVMIKRSTYRKMAADARLDWTFGGKGRCYVSPKGGMKRPVPALWDPFVFEHGGVLRRPAGDTCFFRRARECGFEVWALADMPIDHARMGPMTLVQWQSLNAKRAELLAAGLNGTAAAEVSVGERCGGCQAVIGPEERWTETAGKRLCARCAPPQGDGTGAVALSDGPGDDRA
jgi:hypothetical protein